MKDNVYKLISRDGVEHTLYREDDINLPKNTYSISSKYPYRVIGEKPIEAIDLAGGPMIKLNEVLEGVGKVSFISYINNRYLIHFE